MVAPGILLLNKPQGWTSHDVVAKLRGILGTKKIGHAGTLDPMATGLLVLGVGSGTKFLTYLVGLDKTYSATIRLGQTTVTDDAEGDQTAQSSPAALAQVTLPDIDAGLAALTGQIMQVPSSVSAIKVNGERAYAKVRSGDEVKLAARPIQISRFERTSPPRIEAQFIDIDVVVDCSSGTYIRALARDLGVALGVGGHLTALNRSQVGRYSQLAATDLETLQAVKADGGPFPITPLYEAATAQFFTRVLDDSEERDLRHGKRIAAQGEAKSTVIAAVRDRRLVAMLERTGATLRSTVVFAEEPDA